MATQAAARVQTPPMPRTTRVAQRKPTGRYVYESSSDEEDAEAAPWRPPPRVRGMLDPNALDSDAEEAETSVDADASSTSAHDARSLRLANELDPWDAWEQLCRRRAWARPRERTPRARTQSVTPAPREESDVQELERMLSRFQLQQREVERKEREAFEQRNTRLWDGIERAIREAETRAAHEAEQLAHARRRQEQAEAEARRARETELRRIEAEKRAEEERKEREAQKQRELAELEKKEGAYNTMRGGERVWRTAASEYGAWRDRMLHIKQDVLAVIAGDSDRRKRCFAAKRAITPKVGQLTNTREEVVRITTALADILAEARTGDADARMAERIYYWTLNHLAKCLIRQAEQEVAAKQDTAFPLARLVLGLALLGHTALGEVLMARLVKKCPYVLGYLPPREDGEANAAYRKRLGFKDEEESVQMYANRMSGIAALYFACLQTRLGSVAQVLPATGTVPVAQLAERVPACLQPSRLWTWQVRCTTPPLTQQALVPALWCVFLEVAGPGVLERYGRQGAKLWRLLLQEGVRGKRLGPGAEQTADPVQGEAVRSALVRLELLLDTWAQSGSLGEHATAGRELGV